jgi:hypothetical protein
MVTDEIETAHELRACGGDCPECQRERAEIRDALDDELYDEPEPETYDDLGTGAHYYCEEGTDDDPTPTHRCGG